MLKESLSVEAKSLPIARFPRPTHFHAFYEGKLRSTASCWSGGFSRDFNTLVCFSPKAHCRKAFVTDKIQGLPSANEKLTFFLFSQKLYQ